MFDGQNYLLETTGAGNTVEVAYTVEPKMYGRAISRRKASTSLYYHADALGSVRELTQVGTSILGTYIYDAWGTVLQFSSGGADNPLRWVGLVGYYYDTELATYYVRARHYSPTMARWLSQDPLFWQVMGFIDLDEWSSDDLRNLYRYVGSSPAQSFDPPGLCVACCCCVEDVSIAGITYFGSRVVDQPFLKDDGSIVRVRTDQFGHDFEVSIQLSHKMGGADRPCKLVFHEWTNRASPPAKSKEWFDVVDNARNQTVGTNVTIKPWFDYEKAFKMLGNCDWRTTVTLKDSPSIPLRNYDFRNQQFYSYNLTRNLYFVIGAVSSCDDCAFPSKFKYIHQRLKLRRGEAQVGDDTFMKVYDEYPPHNPLNPNDWPNPPDILETKE